MKGINGPIILSAEVTELNYEGVIVNGSFDFSLTRIKTLKGCPSCVMGNFYCSHMFHAGITSLEGSPEYVAGDFCCYHTNIQSLHNVHKIIRYIGGNFRLPKTIKSHVIGVMMIKGLERIAFINNSEENDEQNQVEDIINRHLYGDRDPHTCQEELFEAGFAEYAKL